MKPKLSFESGPTMINALSRIRSSHWLPIMLILFCAGFAAHAYRAGRYDLRHANAPTMSPASASDIQVSPPEPVQVVTFALYDVGIYPREAHAQEGLVAIIIEDYSGGSSGLLVQRETGNLPEQIGSVEREGPHWRGKSEFRLGPGSYRVRMIDRPGNQAILIVNPRGK